MFRGVTLDVERMRKKKPEGLDFIKQDPVVLG